MQNSNVSQQTVEISLLASCLSAEGKLAEALYRGVARDDFIAAQPVFDFIQRHQSQYRALPKTDVIRAQFPELWQPLDGEFEYWVDAFLQRATARKAQESIKSAIERFGRQENASEIVNGLLADLAQLGAKHSEHIVATDAGIDQRLEKYQARKDAELQPGQTWGIRTGFGIINSTGVGWMPGELVGIVARPTVGKSWILSREAAIAWTQGKRVLYISPENPVNMIQLRFDAILAHLHNIRGFSQRGAFIGSPIVEDSYNKLADVLRGHERWWTMDGLDGRPLGVSDIVAFQRRFQADIVFVDGISLLHKENKSHSVWEEMKYNANSLAYFATTAGIPVVTSNWSVNVARGRKQTEAAGRGDDFRMPTLNDSAYGDAFAQAAHTMITMAPDRKREDVVWYAVRKSRDRECDYRTVGIYWDVDKGRMEDLSEAVGESATLDMAERMSKG